MRKDIIPESEVIFLSGSGNRELGNRILKKLSEYAGCFFKFSHVNFARFADTEPDNKIPDWRNIEGKVVVFYQSLSSAELTEEALDLIYAIKHQYKAEKIIAIFPFIRFRRQDHPEKQEEINRVAMLIDRFAHAGVDCLITATPHSEEIGKNCQKFGIRYIEADASNVFFTAIKPLLLLKENKTFVYAPDQGSIIRAIKVAELLKVGVLFSLKERGFNNAITTVEADDSKIQEIKALYNYFPNLNYATNELIKGSEIIMIEDEISTGSTANSTGCLLKENGAKAVILAATHAVCVDGWKRKLLNKDPWTKIIIADTIYRDNKQRTGGFMHDVSMNGPLSAELFKLLRDIFTTNSIN